MDPLTSRSSVLQKMRNGYPLLLIELSVSIGMILRLTGAFSSFSLFRYWRSSLELLAVLKTS